MESGLSYEDLIAVFCASSGEENARDIVSQALRALAMGEKRAFTFEQALSILGEIAKTPGLIGITARLASTRIHLRLARGSSQKAIDILKGA